MKRLVLAVILASASAQAAPVTVTPLLNSSETATGQRLELPENPELRVSTYVIEPGARLPLHQHPYQRYAYILEGMIEVHYAQGNKVIPSKAGEFIVEGRGQWHYGVNTGTVPAKLLVIDHVPTGTDTNTIVKSPH